MSNLKEINLIKGETSSSLGESTPSIEGSNESNSTDNCDVSTTLYFGNLHAFVQQSSLEDLCTYFGPVDSAKVIKDKGSGSSAGYGFVKFSDRVVAEAALQALNGKSYLGQEIRVNWALPNNHKEDTSHHYHIFVGDLGSEVTDAMLYNTFCTIGQCSDARVMWDHNTGRSKGYGFVSFRRKEDADASIEQMQGLQVGSRRIRVGWAQHKQDASYLNMDMAAVDRADPANTNVYLGNIAPETTEDDLMQHFDVYGLIAEVKLHKKGGYGFVKFEMHESAVKAIVGSQGRQLHGRVIKCAWGKNISTFITPAPVAANPAVLSLAAALQGSHIGNLGLQAQQPNVMASASLAAAANAIAAAAAVSGGHSGAGLSSPFLGLGLPQAQPHAGLLNVNMNATNPSLYNNQVLPVALATQMLMMQGLQNHHHMDTLGLQAAALGLTNHALTAGNMQMDGSALHLQPRLSGVGSGGGLYGINQMYGGGGLMRFQ